jgi:Zn-dependent protease with chaperone function
MVSAGRLVASLFVLCALVLGVSVDAATAQTSPPAPTPELAVHPEGQGTTASGGTAQATPTPAGAAAPAPTPAFDPQAATRAWLAKVPAADKERSDAYFEGGYWLQLWDLVYTLAVAWLLLGTGISRRLRELAQRTTRFRPLQTGIYALGYTLLVAVLGFPLNVYRDFFREHKYQLSNQTFGEWMSDLAKGLGVGLVLATLGLMLLYGVLRRTPRTWWIWGALVVLALLAVVVIIAPVYISPLFNKYTALTDAKVRDPILRMAQANGVPADNVWVFDASKQTKRISANVSGFMGTERVSLNDNLLERATLPEIESVMGHELGHYVLNHVYEDFFELGLVIVLASHSCAPPSTACAGAGARAGASPASTTPPGCRCSPRCSPSSSSSPRRRPTPSSAATRRRPTPSASTRRGSLRASLPSRSSSASTASSTPARSRNGSSSTTRAARTAS